VRVEHRVEAPSLPGSLQDCRRAHAEEPPMKEPPTAALYAFHNYREIFPNWHYSLPEWGLLRKVVSGGASASRA
jgi:hypothetical protein